jgi:serine/threonine protein kinase
MVLIQGESLGIPLEFPITVWRKAIPLVPLLKGGKIEYHKTIENHLNPGQKGVVMREGPYMYEGAFGKLTLYTRNSEAGEQTVLCKSPKIASDLLLSEALVQFAVHTLFANNGFGMHIPRVFDIFKCESGEIRFTMEHKAGKPLVEWLLQSPTIEMDFGICLAQIAIILEILHTKCGVDHRDMKMDNLLVVEESLHLRIGLKYYTFPFTIVLIDFGFCCVGELDISKGAFPALDACPKEGRDMFHLLASAWSIPALRGRLHATWENWMLSHLVSNTGRSYKEIAERVKNNEWIYLLSGTEKFRAPMCTPQQILHDLHADEWLE